MFSKLFSFFLCFLVVNLVANDFILVVNSKIIPTSFFGKTSIKPTPSSPVSNPHLILHSQTPPPQSSHILVMQTSMTFIFYLSRMKVYVVEEICNRIDCCRIIDNICVYYLTEKNQWGLLTGDDEVGFMDIDYWSNHPFINFPMIFPSLS